MAKKDKREMPEISYLGAGKDRTNSCTTAN
jgi:hypothetical protein